MKSVLLLMMLIPAVGNACQCFRTGAADIYTSSDLVYVLEANGNIVEENGVRLITGKVKEVFKGNLIIGQDIKIDYRYKTSCEAISGNESSFLVASFLRDAHGFPSSSKCYMWYIDSIKVGDELFEPSETSIQLLKSFRAFTNKQMPLDVKMGSD